MSLIGKTQRPVLPRGTVLDDRFEIGEFLGAGSFGEVYSAKQLIFGSPFRRVALKLFGADRVSSENVGDVLQDAVTLLGLREENPSPAVDRHIVQVYDMGMLKTPTPRAFMSMKLVPGKRTLDNEVRRFRDAGGMPVATSLRYLRQILVPLAWMHSLETPILHADIKPDNVLMTEDSNLVLTDFGLAVRMPLAGISGAGAIQYQAPEQLWRHEAGPSSMIELTAAVDMYAVGLTWYEMLTGRHPFAEAGMEATAQGDDRGFSRAQLQARKWQIRPPRPGVPDHEDERIPPASELNPELREHPRLEAMLNRCLEYRQSQRYQNARLLLTDIDNYLRPPAGAPESPPLPGGPDTIPPEPPDLEDQKDSPLPEKTPAMRISDAKALLAQGKADQALALAEELLRKDPKYAPALVIGARAHARRKGIGRAKEMCAKAQSLAPKDPELYEAMAEVLEAEGNDAMAKQMRLHAGKLRDEDRARRKL